MWCCVAGGVLFRLTGGECSHARVWLVIGLSCCGRVLVMVFWLFCVGVWCLVFGRFLVRGCDRGRFLVCGLLARLVVGCCLSLIHI